MNVLERVRGCNRIIVQGHREMETQQMEGRGFGSVVLTEGREEGREWEGEKGEGRNMRGKRETWIACVL